VHTPVCRAPAAQQQVLLQVPRLLQPRLLLLSCWRRKRRLQLQQRPRQPRRPPRSSGRQQPRQHQLLALSQQPWWKAAAGRYQQHQQQALHLSKRAAVWPHWRPAHTQVSRDYRQAGQEQQTPQTTLPLRGQQHCPRQYQGMISTQ
jgi:hypothetical protein